MDITILDSFCKAIYRSNIINFYVTEASSHSPLPVSKYHFVQYTLGVSNPGVAWQFAVLERIFI